LRQRALVVNGAADSDDDVDDDDDDDNDVCMCSAHMSSQLMSLTVNTRLQHVCVGRSTADDVVCYNSSGRRMLSLSTVGVSVFAVAYDSISGLHNELST